MDKFESGKKVIYGRQNKMGRGRGQAHLPQDSEVDVQKRGLGSERTVQQLIRVANRGSQRRHSSPDCGVRTEISAISCHRNNLSEFVRKDFVKGSCSLWYTGCGLKFESSALFMLCLKGVALRQSVTKMEPLPNPVLVHTLKKARGPKVALTLSPCSLCDVLSLKGRKMRTRQRGHFWKATVLARLAFISRTSSGIWPWLI